MKKDNIGQLVRKDELLCTYGSFLLAGKGAKKAGYVSQELRLLGRLLFALQEALDVEEGLINILEPQYFDDVIKITKDLAGYSTTNVDGEFLPTFKKPSVPLKTGYALNNIFSLMKGIGLRKKNDTLITNAEYLTSLYKAEWGTLISSASLRTLDENKFNKSVVLPLTSDLLKLKNHCEQRIVTLTEELSIKQDVDTWRALAEIIVTRLTILNKRRENESSNLLVSSFLKRNEQHKTFADSVLESLSSLEKKLMER